jgi:hypothetical protein
MGLLEQKIMNLAQIFILNIRVSTRSTYSRTNLSPGYIDKRFGSDISVQYLEASKAFVFPQLG